MSLFSKKAEFSPREGAPSKTGYGINEAAQLMRALPIEQNVELVVRVIRGTLESMNVQLPAIIEDAETKERALEERRETLNGEIAALAREIEERRQEIAAIEGELRETTTVKDRLLLAQRLGDQPVPAGPPPLPLKLNGNKPAELTAR